MENVPVKSRNYLFDNIKGISIFLVVLLHAFDWYLETPIVLYTASAFYPFVMPLFILVSGYFSKSKNSEYNMLTKAVPMYIVSEILYSLLLFAATGKHSFSLFKPISIYWYLMALIIYRVVCVKFFKTKMIIPVLFAVGIIAGFDKMLDEGVLALAPTVALCGFFALGYFMTEENVINLRKHKWVGCLSLVLAAAIIVFWEYGGTVGWYEIDSLFRSSYKTPLGAVSRLLHYLSGFLVSVSAICLIPDKKTFLCKIGQNSLYVYLLHVFVIGGIRLVNPFAAVDLANYIFLIAVSVLCTFVFSRDFVAVCVNKIITPLEKLMKKIVKPPVVQ